MSDVKVFSETETYKNAQKRAFRYPSEEETLVRRLGSAVLAVWSTLPAEARQRIRAEALSAWDREYYVPGLEKKLDLFIKRYPARLG
jgi:hypothetical protein